MTDQPSPPEISPAPNWWKQHWRVLIICLVLAAITVAVFGQTTGFGFLNYDDSIYVYENAKVTAGLSLKGLAWVFTHADCNLYHPLTMLSLMADYQFHGLRAGGYHLTNVLLHTASVILLFLILRQMTGALWRSAFVAAVFAIHPLRVESVAWVAERKDVLAAFFFMLTLGAYVHYVRKPNSPARYLMVVLAFVAGLLSKPTVVMLPFVLLLLDYWPLNRFEPRKLSRLVLEKIPLLALTAGACAMTVLAAEKLIVPSAHISMASRIGNALVSYAVYLRQMIWPVDLAVFYPRPATGYPAWTVALSLLLLALITGGVLAFQRKRRWLLVGWLWYLGMLLPMIGLVHVGEFAHADRYTYLPQIGIYLAVAWLVAEWQVNRVALAVLLAGVVIILTLCAKNQAAHWKNSETLWTHTLASTTNNNVAHVNLGADLVKEGRLDEAISHYREALQINPGYGKLDYNLGIALLKEGKVDEAIIHLQRAVQINPDDADAHNNLGIALRQKGRLDEAINQYQEALRINPRFAKAHYNLGNALGQKGNVAEAIAQFQQALEIEPADPGVLNNLAWLLAAGPEASLRNGEKAVELARQANELTGGERPVLLHTLAAAFAEAGRFPEAVETAPRPLRLAEARSNTSLARQLQSEIQSYQLGRAYYIPAQTH
jgi:tetratricopeptide (TPR) repeat protein